MKPAKPTLLTGARPTGLLHLGHYFGAIQNMVALQDSGNYQCFFFSADWHALTTGYRDTKDLRRFRREMIADWLACGIDPKKATIFAQAAILEHAELSTLLGMFTPLSWLERVPSYKDIQQELKDRDLSTIGFLGYPLLQTADIIMYKATHVPVGEDQVAHIELAREVTRRFNSYYQPIFPEPQPLLSQAKRVPGLDSRKMSKSYGNAIYLAETTEEVKQKVMTAPTDPKRIKRTDPGTPEVCNIFAYQKLFQPPVAVEEIAQGCRTAGLGCVDCKKRLLVELEAWRQPIQQKRLKILTSSEVDDVLSDGNKKAQQVAQTTMQEVREVMGL